MNNTYREETLLKIRREFSEKEKYDILMVDYMNIIKKLEELKELKSKYERLREQHKNLQYRYTQLRNKYTNGL
jgi:succinate dehydrogenase/fumarate reductase flavoprotein subunit